MEKKLFLHEMVWKEVGGDGGGGGRGEADAFMT